MTRMQNIYKNVRSLFLYQILYILLGFIARKIFIQSLGVSYLGYNAVFLNILSALNLAELGIGTAVTSFLYKPLADKDTVAISTLMYLYKRIYMVLGTIVAVVGVGVSFFLKNFLADAIHDYTYLQILFLINLVGTVSTYFLAYKRTLLIADQKNYVTANIDSVINIILTILQIICLYVFPRYELYIILTILKNIIANIIISVHCNKKMKFQLKKPDAANVRAYSKKIRVFVRDIFASKIGAYVYYGTDNLIISYYLGSLITGYLSNYYMVVEMLKNIITQVFASTQATMGNYIYSISTPKKEIKMCENYLFSGYMIGNICMICFCFLIQPFIKVFFGAGQLLSNSTSILLGINLLLTILLIVPSQLFIIYGLYNFDKIIIIISALLNIVVSIFLVNRIGINGVLIGTTLTSLIYLFSRLAIISKKRFNLSYFYWYLKFLYYFIISFVCYFISRFIVNYFSAENYLQLIIRAFIIGGLSVFLQLTFFYNTDEFDFFIDKAKIVIGEKIYNLFKSSRLKKIFSYIKYSFVFAVIGILVLNISQFYNSLNREVAYYKELNAQKNKIIQDYVSDDKTIGNSLHFSLDDVIDVFIDLHDNTNKYESIFENQTIASLKEYHDMYGVKFSLYCYYENESFDLSMLSDKFSEQFADNSDWLKFGFHAYNESSEYSNTPGSLIEREYDIFTNEILRITGDEKCLERVIRLHGFAGNIQSVKALLNHQYNITGLLGADDTRQSYYLDKSKSNELSQEGYYKDEQNNCYFWSTNGRMENLTTEQIDNLFKDEHINGMSDTLILFTHEWALNEEMDKQLTYLFEQCILNSYKFGYPLPK